MPRLPLACFSLLAAAVLSFAVPSSRARVLDDFNGNSRSGWTDFTFGLGSITQAPPVLLFQLSEFAPRPAFMASVRGTELFEITSDPIELSIDVAGANRNDTFAVLSWTPEATPATAFAGYFVAKSGKELIVGKAVHKYFYRTPLDSALTNQNVTLAIALSLTNGAILFEVRVVGPQAAGGAVLFDRSFVDSESADNLQEGTDDPPQAYRGKGRFTLMEFSESTDKGVGPTTLSFSNALASAPLPQALIPVFHDMNVPDRASFIAPPGVLFQFLTSGSQIWDAGNPQAWVLGPGLFSEGFGYANVTDYFTLRIHSTAMVHTNTLYEWTMTASQVLGVTNITKLHFDTFSEDDVVIEAEDYNFAAGLFIDNPILTPEGTPLEYDSYRQQVGVSGVDFLYQGTRSASDNYRQDGVGLKQSWDFVRPKFIDSGSSSNGFKDYDVFNLNAGDYLNYTRIFPSSYFLVYLRESLVNMAESVTALELLISDIITGNQTSKPLGFFLGQGSDFLFRNVPLTDRSGNSLTVQLDRAQTVRLRQVSALPADAELSMNYLVFIPVSIVPTLQSAAAVTGPYTTEANASVDPSTMTITLAKPKAAMRFYRLSAEAPLRIISFRTSPEGALTVSFSPSILE